MYHFSSLSFAMLLGLSASAATTFYIDSQNGNDANDGRSPDTAWQTLSKHNTAKNIQPGDTVLLKRGGLWRESLVPHSGEPGRAVRYNAYGEGPLPIIQRSVAAEDEKLWEEVQPGIWRTPVQKGFNVDIKKTLPVDIDAEHWNCYANTANGAKIELKKHQDTDGNTIFTLRCVSAGKVGTDIQYWCLPLMPFDDSLMLKVQGRASRQFYLDNACLMTGGPDYTNCAQVLVSNALDTEWKTVDMLCLHRGETFPNRRFVLHFNLGNQMKTGDEIQLKVLPQAYQVTSKETFSLPIDVGNIIFDHGKQCGWKKWEVEKLEKPYEYVYSIPERCVYLKHDGNPAKSWKSIELVVRAGGVSQGGAHDVIYENLCVRYVGCHGFGGGNTKNLVIRNCDIYFIGGAHQHDIGSRHVRFGNGIEFWGNCDNNLVENNRLWEIYDAALTNQGTNDKETNITYRNNLIWNAEYSFEYWNRDITDNIKFINNTCIDAGCGWGHDQRPDQNGAHLMFFGNRAKTTNFVVHNNVFVNTTEQGMRMDIDWSDVIDMDYNLWFLPSDKPVYRIKPKANPQQFRLTRTADILADRNALPMDHHSIFTQPTFVDATARDYRLAPGSAGLQEASDKGSLGRRQ